MKIFQSETTDFKNHFDDLKKRRERLMDELSTRVDQSIREYREDREAALLRWAKDYDGLQLEEADLWIEEDSIKTSHKLVPSPIRKAIDHAKERVERFQEELRLASFKSSEEQGVFWGTEIRPLDRVGVYVPGGRANYFMTLLLCAVPARLAGVKELIVASPPNRKLEKPYVEPSLLYLAKLFGIPRILLSGSVGAMAALAFGTKKTPRVDKIVGSGGRRAAVAKSRLSGFVGIEGFSGPSETVFICDSSTNIQNIAADIVGKADHDPEAEIFVFQTSNKQTEALIEKLASYVEGLKDPQERTSIQACLEKKTYFYVVKTVDQGIDFANALAPGVLCLAIDGASDWVSKVQACGSLLLGHYTPPVGLDLVGGPSGLVSTMGAASYSVSMSPASFVRRFTVMEFDRSALERFHGESVQLAQEEGFSTHEISFSSRLKGD